MHDGQYDDALSRPFIDQQIGRGDDQLARTGYPPRFPAGGMMHEACRRVSDFCIIFCGGGRIFKFQPFINRQTIGDGGFRLCQFHKSPFVFYRVDLALRSAK